MISERRAEVYLLLTTVFWSGTFVFTKFALDNTDPVFFVTLRFALAALLCLALWYKKLRTLEHDAMQAGVILGAFYGIGFFFQTWGLQYTTISKSAFITGMVVVFIPATNYILQRKKVEFVHTLALIIAIAGMYFLTNPDLGALNYGDVMTLCASILWSFYIPYLDKVSTVHATRENFTEQLVTIQFTTTLLLGILVHIVVYSFSLQNTFQLGLLRVSPDATLYVSLIYTALIGSIASTTIQTKYQRYVPPVKAGIIFALEPIFASAIAYFTNNERLNNQEFIGAGLMIVAVVFADVGKMFIHRAK